MSNNFQKSIAVTIGAAIASTGLFFSLSSHAQVPGTTATPTIPSTTIKQPATGDVMKKPEDAMKKPEGVMKKPEDAMKKPGAMTAGKNIVETAAGNKSFSILVKALKAAGLVETLSGEGPFTVFAPTNAAFEKLPKGILAKLLKPEGKEQLIKILKYHVVAGEVTSKMLKAGPVASVEGSNITVKISSKKVNINNARVTTADIKTSNGVIHIIDNVLLPPTK
jgi:uncharacterized surface protein with fasciclin (FAS1) repeats